MYDAKEKFAKFFQNIFWGVSGIFQPRSFRIMRLSFRLLYLVLKFISKITKDTNLIFLKTVIAIGDEDQYKGIVVAQNPPPELYINPRKVIPFPVALLYKPEKELLSADLCRIQVEDLEPLPVRGFVPQLIVCSQRIHIR